MHSGSNAHTLLAPEGLTPIGHAWSQTEPNTGKVFSAVWPFAAQRTVVVDQCVTQRDVVVDRDLVTVSMDLLVHS